MLQRDASKLKASTGRNDQTSSFPLFEKLLKILCSTPTPDLISSGVSCFFRVLKVAQCVRRTGAADAGAAGGAGRARGHLGRSSALRCAEADGGPPSLPSCSSFSITLSFSSADPPQHGPRRPTAIPWGRKQSLPCVCRSSSWQRVEEMERGLRNNQEVKSRRRKTQSERRAAAAREGREGERAS